MSHAEILCVALLADALIGEPASIWSRLPHPAVLMGRLIAYADRRFNRGTNRRRNGVLVIIGLGTAAILLGLLLTALPFGPLLELALTTILLAHRSLVDHIHDVARALDRSTEDARSAVARIVGRDTTQLTPSGVSRAAIESGAENFSDGVLAPAFWFLVAGLPGLLLYKITNTADSMIGYRTPRHADFGWAAARFDDLMNWVPARLSAAFIALASARPAIWPLIRRDAALHRSPNAGWPEAAMAIILDTALSGPRSYDGRLTAFPWVWPEGRREIGSSDIRACVRALWRTWAALFAAVALLASSCLHLL